MQLREGELTDRQVLSRWLPGAAGAAVEAATRAWTLRELAAPSQAELDTLERLGPRGHNQAAGSWGGELSSLAHELTSGLTVPSAWGGGAAADGDVLARGCSTWRHPERGWPTRTGEALTINC